MSVVDEFGAALIAREGRTAIAGFRSGRVCQVGHAADAAGALNEDCWKTPDGCDLGVGLPKLDFGFPVARGAQRGKVFEQVGVEVGIEEPEGAHVVNGQVLRLKATTLACILVSGAGFAALFGPVFALVFDVSTTPGWVL